MFCESPHNLAWSGDILSKPFSGFDPRLQKHNDILLTNYQKNSIIDLTKAKRKTYLFFRINIFHKIVFVMYVYTLKVYKYSCITKNICNRQWLIIK